MRLVRVLALVVIAGLFAAGVAIDRRDRPIPDRAIPSLASLSVSTGPVQTWFCPGGSGPGGIAELTVEVISAAKSLRTATVTAAPDPSVTVAGTVGGNSPEISANPEPFPLPAPFTADISPGGRVVLSLAEKVPGAKWLGAVVEVPGGDVVVEQVVADGQGGVGRSNCLTQTAEHWVVPYGATRQATEGEQFVMMLLNPYPDFAVADMQLIADVGRDSVEGLVIPARSVVAVNVTDEITVAELVTVVVDVVSGRLAASWIQLTEGPNAGRGTRVAPATPEYSRLWYLPVAAVEPGRRDVVAVTNPSSDQPAEVDMEIILDAPAASVNPIELTIPPQRTVLVDLAREGRLREAGSFTVVVRSLTEVPVATSLASVTGVAIDTFGDEVGDNTAFGDRVGDNTAVGDRVGDNTAFGDDPSTTDDSSLSDDASAASDPSATDDDSATDDPSVADDAPIGDDASAASDPSATDDPSASDSGVDFDAILAGAGIDDPFATTTLGTDSLFASNIVVGTTAAVAANAAARRWLVAAETPITSGGDSGAVVGFHDDASNVVVVNPSSVGIALVDLSVDGEIVRSLELGPQRRARLPLAWLGTGRFVLEVEASSPVIAAREMVGLTSRTASLGVAVAEPVLLRDLPSVPFRDLP